MVMVVLCFAPSWQSKVLFADELYFLGKSSGKCRLLFCSNLGQVGVFLALMIMMGNNGLL